VPNHLSDLAYRLYKLADEWQAEGEGERPADNRQLPSERLRAAAVALEARPCEHAVPADTVWIAAFCQHCGVKLRAQWVPAE